MSEGLSDSFSISRDGHEAVERRRLFNEQYALGPMNFNEVGVREVEMACGQLASKDVWLDIGTGCMYDMWQAVKTTGSQVRLVGADVNSEPYREHRAVYPMPESDFIVGLGENLPFADNSVKVASMFNTIFRVGRWREMLCETARVVEPGGQILISTNQPNHAVQRHTDTITAELALRRKVDDPLVWVPVPAAGLYAEKLKTALKVWPHLQIEKEIRHDSHTIIKPGDSLEAWLQSVKDDVPATGLPPEKYGLWDMVVEDVIRSLCHQRMARTQARLQQARQKLIDKGVSLPPKTIEPMFVDGIHRALFIIQNNK